MAQEQPQEPEAGPEVKAEPPVEELSLRQEIVVEGMGNARLSGLTRCGESFWAVSNRDDEHLYRLVPMDKEAPASWQAEAVPFSVSASVPSVIPWGATVSRTVLGLLRGTYLDFEGIACNDRGDRYLVSESQAAVLQVPPEGEAFWLPLPEVLTRQARASGMLLHFNHLYRGIAVSPDGDHLWLAASRNKRGLLGLYFSGSSWKCRDSCVLLAEGGVHSLPEAFGEDRVVDREFADMVYFQGALFTLERTVSRICRYSLAAGRLQKCWSFAAAALEEGRRYPNLSGAAEALWLDKSGAWVGLDNCGRARADGEDRPLVWRFDAPEKGWMAQ